VGTTICSKHVLRYKTIDVRTTDYLIHVWNRNMYYAYWRNSCIGARTTV